MSLYANNNSKVPIRAPQVIFQPMTLAEVVADGPESECRSVRGRRQTRRDEDGGSAGREVCDSGCWRGQGLWSLGGLELWRIGLENLVTGGAIENGGVAADFGFNTRDVRVGVPWELSCFFGSPDEKHSAAEALQNRLI